MLNSRRTNERIDYDWEEDKNGKAADSDDDEEEEAGNERMSNKFLNFQKK